jgi:pSer/pThr/pTyr-binding forkhead associated (FHA) protein
MADEYKPTRKVEQPEEGHGREDVPGRQRRRSTVPMDERGPNRYGFGASSQPGAVKTERLRVEPPAFAWLVIVEGPHAGHIFRLHPDVTLIGRDPSCDILLDDTAVSRHHAKVRLVEGKDKRKRFVIQDLATENGTFVNDEEIVKHELTDGDRVLIGRRGLVFKQIEVE